MLPPTSGAQPGPAQAPQLVTSQGEAVDYEGVRQQIEVLAFVSNGVGPTKPQRVVEGTVDGLGVIAAAEPLGLLRQVHQMIVTGPPRKATAITSRSRIRP